MSLMVGDRAPGFTLPSEPGNQVDVGALIGKEKVVLLFFPLAFSPVCTTEMCTIGGAWGEWSELQANVFAISVDSPFVTEKFRTEENIPFLILSDFNRRVASQYDVLCRSLSGLEGVAKRSVFVIDETGTIVYSWVTEDPGVEPDYEAVKAAVRSS